MKDHVASDMERLCSMHMVYFNLGSTLWPSKIRLKKERQFPVLFDHGTAGSLDTRVHSIPSLDTVPSVWSITGTVT